MLGLNHWNHGLLRLRHCRSDALTHRVDWVTSFFFSRPNWDPHPPLPAGECVPPLVQGGYTLACGRGGGGGPNSDSRFTYTLYVLCALTSRHLIHKKVPLQKITTLLTFWVFIVRQSYFTALLYSVSNINQSYRVMQYIDSNTHYNILPEK
jgi:hypothetical protein